MGLFGKEVRLYATVLYKLRGRLPTGLRANVNQVLTSKAVSEARSVKVLKWVRPANAVRVVLLAVRAHDYGGPLAGPCRWPHEKSIDDRMNFQESVHHVATCNLKIFLIGPTKATMANDAFWPLEQFPEPFQAFLITVHTHFMTTHVHNHIHLWVYTTPDGILVSMDRALPVQVLPLTNDAASVQVTASVAQALDWLHAAGVAHVDLHMYVDNWNTANVLRGQPARARPELQRRIAARLRQWQGRRWVSVVAPSERMTHPMYVHCAAAAPSAPSAPSSSPSSSSSVISSTVAAPPDASDDPMPLSLPPFI